MMLTWALLYTAAVVSADVGLGYNYKVPQRSYGVPPYQFGANSGQYEYSGIGYGYYSRLGHQSLRDRYLSRLGTGYYQPSGGSSFSKVLPAAYYAGHNGLGSGYRNEYSSSSQYQTAAEKYQQYYEIQQQPTQVFKHFYVHAAPEEPEPVKPRVPVVLPPAQKHYKIIFVKTPTESLRSQAIIPIQPQNEEKTIVYVLVKKPEDQQEVIVPKIEQKPPSKPEVYFIKYKNKEDPQALINDIVKDYNQGIKVSLVDSGIGENSFNAASGSGDTSINGASSFAGFETPVISQASTGSQSFGASTQGSAVALASTSSIDDNNEANFASSIAAPVASSTASSIDYDGENAIPTSQGVPHVVYGPPKFRV